MFRDMTEIHANCVPEGFEIDDRKRSGADSQLRGRILSGATKIGARFSKAATRSRPLTQLPTRGLLPRLPRLFSRPVFSFAAGAVFALAMAGAGDLALRGRLTQQRTGQSDVNSTAKNALPGDASPHTGVVAPAGLSADVARREAELERALKRAREERLQLQRELAEAQAKAEQVEENDAAATRRVSELEQQLTASSANEAQAQTELAKLKEAHSTDQVALASQEQAIRDLSTKLEQQSAAIDREKQLLSAGREIRDVIAARNLHIIDVYDTDGEGKTKKAFGRAFYTEGKSLVFYAYDLPAHRTENAKYAYYAWGKSDGSDHAVRSLGLMYSDDQAQKRWVLKVIDPEVLSQIDSVFITLERIDNPGNRPRGKELLSAYLHSPANHP